MILGKNESSTINNDDKALKDESSYLKTDIFRDQQTNKNALEEQNNDTAVLAIDNLLQVTYVSFDTHQGTGQSDLQPANLGISSVTNNN